MKKLVFERASIHEYCIRDAKTHKYWGHATYDTSRREWGFHTSEWVAYTADHLAEILRFCRKLNRKGKP